MSTKTPHATDVIVGRNVRLIRTQRGVSQTELAKALSLTFQQVQKYEKGTNRISASKLYEIANYFGVGIATLFSGVEEPGNDGSLFPFGADALTVARSFDQIGNPKVREKIRALVAALSANLIDE
jgi:transcriptional regulator with XRE-family HTH domain